MNEIEQKEIEEMAKILKGYCCLISGNPTKGDCYQCKQANASCYNYAEHIYNAGYRNCKDKVVLTEREHEIAMKNQYDVGFRFGCKKMQEELAKASELKADTIKLAKQETAREIIESVDAHIPITLKFCIAKEYNVEVE